MPIEQLLALYGYGGEAKEDGSEDCSGESEKGDETSLAGRLTNDQEGKSVEPDSESSQSCETKQRCHDEEHQESVSVTANSRISPLPSTKPTSNDHGLSLLLCEETLVAEDGPQLKDHKLLHRNDSIRLTHNSQIPWANAVGMSRKEHYNVKQGTGKKLVCMCK